MTKSDPNHNDFECPNCGEWLSVPLPYPSRVECPWCRKMLNINVDAEFDEGVWHDRTELSVMEDKKHGAT